MTFSLSKRIQLRNGRDVRILDPNTRNDSYPIVGMIQELDGNEYAQTWTTSGRVFGDSETDPLDLVNVEPVKTTVYKNFDMENMWGGDFDSVLQAARLENRADDYGKKPLGVLRIDLEDGIPVEVELAYTYRAPEQFA